MEQLKRRSLLTIIENDPAMRITVNFPFYAATGNESSAVVYFEIESGRYLGSHTDSAEEILLILSCTVEATVGESLWHI